MSANFAIISGDFPKSGIALPLGNRKVRMAALRALLLYKGNNFWSRARINLLRVFNFKFVWRILFRTVHENELSTFNFQLRTNTFSVYVGSRKYNLPLFDAKTGEQIGHARAYFPESAEYGKNEVRALEELEKIKFKDFSFPKVLKKEEIGTLFVVTLSALPKGTERTKKIGSRHLEFLKLLSEKTGKQLKFEDSDFYKEFQKEMESMKSVMPQKRELIEYVFDVARKNLDGKEFLFSLTKREFPFFEMFKVSDVSSSPKALRAEGLGPRSHVVLDWEHARFGWPAIFDAYSLIMSDAPHTRGEYAELYVKNITSLFFEKNKRHSEFLKEALGNFGITREEAYWWFLLFLLDQLFIHWDAGHIRSAERVLSFFRFASEHEEGLQKEWFG